jgi:hypothetical protein
MSTMSPRSYTYTVPFPDAFHRTSRINRFSLKYTDTVSTPFFVVGIARMSVSHRITFKLFRDRSFSRRLSQTRRASATLEICGQKVTSCVSMSWGLPFFVILICVARMGKEKRTERRTEHELATHAPCKSQLGSHVNSNCTAAYPLKA